MDDTPESHETDDLAAASASDADAVELRRENRRLQGEVATLRSGLQEAAWHQRDHEQRLRRERERRAELESRYEQARRREDQIKNTLSWAIVSSVWRLTGALAPSGSRQERVLGRLVALAHRVFRRSPRGDHLELGKPHNEATAEAIAGSRSTPRPFVAPVWQAPGQLRPHGGAVDIVICICDALADVQRCLGSVLEHSTQPYRLVLVDDGSQAPTQHFLHAWAAETGAMLIRHSEPRGYTIAANVGMKASSAPYVVLLNSDTIVFPEWLDRLIGCAESSSRIGIVGPLSNSASWQSIPTIESVDQTDWAKNRIPSDVSGQEFSALLAADSVRAFPRVPLLNGFCLLIRRSVLESLGLFDESAFGRGYGEENDLCLRAQARGVELAVADDVYVFHEQSKSYSHERRRQLYEHADEALRLKHGSGVVDAAVAEMRANRVLAGVRARALVLADREETVRQGLARWSGRRVTFLLPVGALGGGAKVVLQEARAMRRMGVDARVANVVSLRDGFERARARYDVPCVYVRSPQELGSAVLDMDAVVATMHSTVQWLGHGAETVGRAVPAYYVQDFEPWFYDEDAAERRQALASYTWRPDLVCLTKTEWNRDIVSRETGVHCSVVGPSVDLDTCRPLPRRDGSWPHRALRIAAMVRPSSARRQPSLTVEVLSRVKRDRPSVDIVVFGCEPVEPVLQEVSNQPGVFAAGVLNDRESVARLLNEVDVFLDLSVYQAMGLTALEAMACGVAVVVPANGGAASFARSEDNSLVVDTASVSHCVRAVERLIDDDALRNRLAAGGLETSAFHFPEKAAFRMLAALFG